MHQLEICRFHDLLKLSVEYVKHSQLDFLWGLEHCLYLFEYPVVVEDDLRILRKAWYLPLERVECNLSGALDAVVQS